MSLRIGVLIGSVREGRVGDRVAGWVERAAGARTALEITRIDLRDYPMPFYPYPTPAKVAEKTYTDERTKAFQAQIASHDGFIIVTPEYNHGYPAALKNALDHVYAGWNKKPVAFVSYGGSSGGIRAVQQLRQVAVELQMAPLRDEVNIGFAMKALGPDGTPGEAIHQTRLETVLTELTWWAQALKAARG